MEDWLWAVAAGDEDTREVWVHEVGFRVSRYKYMSLFPRPHMSFALSGNSQVAGMVSGDSDPAPAYPMGSALSPITSPRGLNDYQNRPLIGELTTGDRGMGPRCQI